MGWQENVWGPWDMCSNVPIHSGLMPCQVLLQITGSKLCTRRRHAAGMEDHSSGGKLCLRQPFLPLTLTTVLSLMVFPREEASASLVLVLGASPVKAGMPDTAEPRPRELPLRGSCGCDGVGVSQSNAAVKMPAIRRRPWVAPHEGCSTRTAARVWLLPLPA